MRERKKICRCGKIILETDKCCTTKFTKLTQKQWKENNRESERIISSRKWGKFRLQIIERDNYHCQRCLHKYGRIETTRLEVHHIRPRSKYPELIFERTNVITLCKTCNISLGTRETLDFKWECPDTEREIRLF